MGVRFSPSAPIFRVYLKGMKIIVPYYYQAKEFIGYDSLIDAATIASALTTLFLSIARFTKGYNLTVSVDEREDGPVLVINGANEYIEGRIDQIDFGHYIEKD